MTKSKTRTPLASLPPTPPACLAAAALPVASAGAAETSRGIWHPRPQTAPWQWQLQGKTDTSVEANIYDVDGFETPKKTVEELHSQGRKAICYVDVGSWEPYRPD